jgi:tRNA/tmRNA/rRNA uracil-C5-methylase (TrmA/RlmC/RlmD family)
MIRRVSIETLAPTGEGVARSADGVGFVAGALPGEDVDAEVLESRKRFWKGRAVAILEASADRLSGGHADGCPACDWALLPLEKAREWKRALFLETMERIGGLPRELFGELPIAASPPGYRLRNRFQVSGRGVETGVGFFAPRSHRVEPASACEALGEGMRELLPRLAAAVGDTGAAVSRIETVESFDGSRRLARISVAPGEGGAGVHALSEGLAPLFEGAAVAGPRGEVLSQSGPTRLWLSIGGREFPLRAGTFFQGNRFLVPELYRDVVARAGSIPAGRALDAFGGAGLLAGALLDAGHFVETVEGDHAAVELALEARKRWSAPGWRVHRSAVRALVEAEADAFDVAVVDPPRAGLGLELAAAMPRLVGRRLLYVSCEPATLARDLAALRSGGLEIDGAKLYDFFAFTHRVEALVSLSRTGGR